MKRFVISICVLLSCAMQKGIVSKPITVTNDTQEAFTITRLSVYTSSDSDAYHSTSLGVVVAPGESLALKVKGEVANVYYIVIKRARERGEYTWKIFAQNETIHALLPYSEVQRVAFGSRTYNGMHIERRHEYKTLGGGGISRSKRVVDTSFF